MKINITGKNLDLTPAFTEYVENHLNGLNKFLEKFDVDSVQAHVVSARTTNHHNHGDVYQSEINLSIPGKVLVAKAEADDARISIDAAVDKLKHELIKHKEQTSDHQRAI